ncbi:MAG TPA: hypothetical protein VF184_05840 [Phycisphaeraceae bacterium]
MDLEELALWAAWHQDHDPELRADLRAGVLAATVASAAFGNRRRWKPEDFFPGLNPRGNRARSDEEIRKSALAWCAMVGEVKGPRKGQTEGKA